MKKEKEKEKEENAAGETYAGPHGDPGVGNGTDTRGETREIRHTISSEETFTLLKDVYDIRCVIRKVYNNREVIARRVHFLTFILGIIFTLLYIAYAVYAGIYSKLSMGWSVTLTAMAGLYVIAAAVMIILGAARPSRRAGDMKRYSRMLRIFRYAVKILSAAVAICALALSISQSSASASSVAFATVMIVISIVIIIIELLPVLFGGIGGLARWLMSPPKGRAKCSAVALEWYDTVRRGGSSLRSAGRVSKEYMEDIERVIDTHIIPSMGKKKITAVTSADIMAVLDGTDESDRYVTGGVMKNLFAYAKECGYVFDDPCRDLPLEGDINEAERKSIGQRIKDAGKNVGKKIGKSVLDRFLSSDS